MAKNADLTPILSEKVGAFVISLMLDNRNAKRPEKGMVFRINYCTTRKYYSLSQRFTDDEYEKIKISVTRGRAAQVRGKNARDWYVELSELFESVIVRAKELQAAGQLTFDTLRITLDGGVNTQNEDNFLTLWDEVIAMQRNPGTAQNYQRAKNNFVRHVGEKVEGYAVVALIRQWDAQIRGELALTTVGIMERACRVVVNEAIQRGLMTRDSYPFGRGRHGKIQIPTGSTRKSEFLTVEQMTRLYKFFMAPEYPKTWQARQKYNATRSLGLFLVQYLGNGFNLSDAARLTYTPEYMEREDKSFRFMRHKTKDRAEESSEVRIPVTKELEALLFHKIEFCGSSSNAPKVYTGTLAATPAPGARVFPDILGDVTDETKILDIIHEENKHIRESVGRICDLLELGVKASSTWARHSFATNLTHRGVPQRYISESMGHSTDKDITARYIQTYPYETQVRYNSLLLDLEQDAKKDAGDLDHADLAELLKGVSVSELKSILANMKK